MEKPTDSHRMINVASTLSLATHADIVLTSIGTLEKVTDSNPWLGYMTKEMFDEIRDQGATRKFGTNLKPFPLT